MSEPSFLTCKLLGITVRFVGRPGELLERLQARYGAAVSDDVGVLSMDVLVVRDEDGWCVRVGEGPTFSSRHGDEVMQHVDDVLLKDLLARVPKLDCIHAGVVAHQGLAVALPGLARTGKSVLVAALVQAGMRYLSDEILAHHREEQVIGAFPRGLSLPEEGVNHFPDLAEAFIPLNYGRLLPVHALGPDVVSGPVPLGAVVIPTWEPARPDEIRPIPRAQAAAFMAETHIVLPGDQDVSPPDFQSLLATPRTFELTWRDPHTAAALVRDALS